jgi:hypothetical protein
MSHKFIGKLVEFKWTFYQMVFPPSSVMRPGWYNNTGLRESRKETGLVLGVVATESFIIGKKEYGGTELMVTMLDQQGQVIVFNVKPSNYNAGVVL